MNSKEIALSGGLIALAWLVHFLMRFTESITGELQAAISISFYCLMVLLIRMSLSEATVLGLITGAVLMTATASPFPLANIPSHWAGLVSCKIVADRMRNGAKGLRPSAVSVSVLLATAVSFLVFVLASYFGILTFPDLARGSSGLIEAVLDGRLTLGAFATNSLLKVGIPTMVSNAVISPMLYILARRKYIEVGDRR
ncbi:MAG: hypothetical protein WCY97_03140 [Methanothrix sp.]|jgi:hypothetical protein|uniref:Uncharacterized protein n=1 Tax=Methanothrix harundinacea TaxID=301375 RepID=A0A101FV29_9EURY|nr:MAG: Uncharacterized protein XD72_0573 [Methanothrix harundinacea]MDD2638000.1 hypothetical protein [Methanothrix sp.]MDI9399529.1 hypothetical protein [Euryarchaeota archaeon]KUK96235.1 MAG: Uncharacterized protein XE07_1261 [Methanothrix harundinacea]MCP1391679.1 hypothetical protein [Methanothrix harundinacea]